MATVDADATTIITAITFNTPLMRLLQMVGDDAVIIDITIIIIIKPRIGEVTVNFLYSLNGTNHGVILPRKEVAILISLVRKTYRYQSIFSWIK